MKAAIICDTHWGARGDSSAFLDHFQRFYEEQFFPYLVEHNIKTVIHLGDLVDRRKYVNFLVAERMRKVFVERVVEDDIQMIVIPGNHDCPFKNSIRVNALRELLPRTDNFRIVDHPSHLIFDKQRVLMIPWVCDENREETDRVIEQSDSDLAMGHLELAGFEMYRGQVNEHGDDPGKYGKFLAVLSGHFHHKSSRGNIHYLGAPYEMTWADAGDPRGFHVIDFDDLKLEFIENPLKMHHKIHLDEIKDLGTLIDGPQGIVKLIVPPGADPSWVEHVAAHFEQSAHDVKVVDDHLNVDSIDAEAVFEAAGGDLVEILRGFADELNDPGVDKAELKQLLDELHSEALMSQL